MKKNKKGDTTLVFYTMQRCECQLNKSKSRDFETVEFLKYIQQKKCKMFRNAFWETILKKKLKNYF